MAEWRSRVLIGAAVAFLAPLSARLGTPAGGATREAARSTRASRAAVKESGDATKKTVRTGSDVARGTGSADTESEFRENLCSFLVLYARSSPLGKATRRAGNAQVCADPAPGAVEAMIAIVPDPVRTHLALRFDRAMDDIESSVTSLGWRFHKAWLPWSNDEPTTPARVLDRDVDEQMQEGREDEPGLLLFRNQDAIKPLVVLLVGDTPTGGVNAEQFRRAVKAWKKLHSDQPSTCIDKAKESCTNTPERLMILGPTFSGSIPSLESLIDEAFARPKNGSCDAANIAIPVASGTISSGKDMQKLWDMDGACWRNVDTSPVSFGEDISYVRTHLLRFLSDHLANKDRGIAELVEGESQFGAIAGEDQEKKLEARQQDLEKLLAQLGDKQNALKAAANGDRGKDLSDEKREKLASAAASLKEDVKSTREDIRDTEKLAKLLQRSSPARTPLQFTFPRGISLLRKAYEQNGILGFGRSGSDAPKTQLQLNFQESADGDAVPAFSGDQGASSMESRMAQIAATLEKDKVAVAVLSATDVLDTIFVARYVRAHAPSVTIVIQDADLLFLRGGADTSLDGVYVVSPYPLIPRNGIWSADRQSETASMQSDLADQNDALENRPVLAESQGDEGTVNAAIYLLCGGDRHSGSSADPAACHWTSRPGFDGNYLWLPEYEPPFPVDAGTDNAYKLHPPIWLSVIGHGGFQPVSLIDLDQRRLGLVSSSADSVQASALSLPEMGKVPEGVHVPSTEPRGIGDEPLGQLYVVTAGLLMLVAVHAWACTRCRLDRSFAWSYAAADEKPWLKRLGVQAGVNMLGIYALSVLMIHDAEGFHLETLRFKLLLLSAQIALVLLTGAVAWRSAAGGGTSVKHTTITGAALLVSGAFVLLADFVLPHLLVPNSDLTAERTFFFYRSAYLLNGACPALPLLLLTGALALWLRGRLAKLVFYGYRIPKLPGGGQEFRCPCDDEVKDLNELLGAPLWERGAENKLTINAQKVRLAALSVALVSIVLLLARQLGPHSLAYSHFDEEVDVIAFAVAVAIVHNLLVAGVAWHLLKGECLTPLHQSPLRWGFNWIRGFSWKRLLTSPEGFTAQAELEYVVRNVEADRRGLAALCPASSLQTAYEELIEKYDSHDKDTAQCSFFERAASSAKWAEGLAQISQRLYTALADEANERLLRLKLQWRTDSGPVTGPETTRGLHLERKSEELKDDAERRTALQRTADEEFAALVYVTYIRSVLVQIRNRIGTSAGMYILLLWVLTGYPWMNRHSIVVQMSLLLALLAVVAITIYAQIQRDEILSRTTETSAGKLGGEFFTKILAVVGVPALSLVASQFPEFSNLIFSWLEPGLSTMR